MHVFQIFSSLFQLKNSYQPDEDADELYDISVSNGIQTAREGVEDCDEGRNDDRHVHAQLQNHR